MNHQFLASPLVHEHEDRTAPAAMNFVPHGVIGVLAHRLHFLVAQGE